VGGFAWMGFAFPLTMSFWVKTFTVVDGLTEEEVDLEAYRCCRWVKWIKPIWVLRFVIQGWENVDF
jgi:hypothetical protein